jgi:hypothetical protein
MDFSFAPVTLSRSWGRSPLNSRVCRFKIITRKSASSAWSGKICMVSSTVLWPLPPLQVGSRQTMSRAARTFFMGGPVTEGEGLRDPMTMVG